MGFSSTNNSSVTTSATLYSRIDYQQDTIPKAQPADTTEVATEGINPLFLMIERKTQQVDSIKQQAEQPKVPAPRRVVIPKVDTTCYLCRDGSHLPLYELIKNNPQFNQLPFVDETLYDANYYNEHINLNQQVFIELKPSKHTQTITINQRVEPNVKSQWLFYPMVGALILLVFLKLFFTKQLNELVKSALFFHIGKKITRDNPIVLNRVFRILDFTLLISIPIAAIQAINLLGLNSSVDINNITLSLYIIAGLLGYRAFRFIAFKLMGYIANQGQAMDLLHTNQLVYTRIFGVLLIPLNLLMLYVSSSAQLIFMYLTATIAVIIFGYRLLRTIQVFLYSRFSMFYLFLYLCALEIIPVLIIIKEIT